MRALLIDDSLLLRTMVERAIRASGLAIAEFVHATNGKDALQVLRGDRREGKKIDLIVTDTNMPLMTGLEFLKQMQSENLCPGVQIIMVTTENSEHISPGPRQQARKATFRNPSHPNKSRR